MKKAKVIVLFVVLAIIMIAGIIPCIMKYRYEEERKRDIDVMLPGYNEDLQMLSGYLRCMYYAEQSGIKIDAALKTDIEEFAESIRDIIEEANVEGDLNLILLQHLAYIYEYYDFDYSKVKAELDKCYISEEKLFNGRVYSEENPKSREYEGSSLDLYRTLCEVGLEILEGYELEKGLVNWFNTTLPQVKTEEGDLSNYYSVIYTAYDTEWSEELEYEHMKDRMEYELDLIRAEMGKYEASIYDVALLEEGIVYSSYLSQDGKVFLENANALYNDISTFEGFGYDIEDCYCMMIVSYYLQDHYVACGTVYNDFLDENINTMLREHFDKYCKGKIE